MLSEPKTDPLLGREIGGRYRIEAKIGQGGMGSVYRARNIVTGKVVAIKVLLEDLAAYDSFVQRFLHEARAAAYLNHPHAINIIDCGRDGNVVYLLMEYVEGRTLKEVMRTEGMLSVERAAAILRQICGAVAEAHAQSIIHRDLKPDNIMLQQVAGEIDYVKVLDFGIAKVLDEQKLVTAPVSRNVFVGTPEYASPEQCNAKDPTHLSDIYSLGTILYEMLSGTPPFTGEPMQVMRQHVEEEPERLREHRPDLPGEVEAVVAQALSKDPSKRPAQVLDLAREFEMAAFGDVVDRYDAQDAPTMPRQGVALVTTPTEPATVQPVRGRLVIFRRLFNSGKKRWRWGLGMALLAVAAGSVHQSYTWYQRAPVIPDAPEMALPKPPVFPDESIGLAQRLFDEGNRDGAIREIRRVLDTSRNPNPGAHLMLGRIYADQGDYSGAAKEYQLALEETRGSYPEAHYWYGRLLTDRGQEQEGSEHFQQALEVSQRQHVPTLVLLGERALREGDAEKAESLFREIVAQADDSPEALLEVGKILLVRQQYDLAARELRRAIAARGGVNPEAEMVLGLTLARQGNMQGAAENLMRAIDRRGGSFPDARLALAQLMYDQSNIPESLDQVRAAIRLRGGNYPLAECLLATILADWRVAQFSEAVQQLHLAVSHRGGRFPDADQVLWRVYFSRLGQLSEARKIWDRMGDGSRPDLIADAQVLRSGGGPTAGVPLPFRIVEPEHSVSFRVCPLGTPSQRTTITFRVGSGGLSFRWQPEEENREGRWVAYWVGPEGERMLLDPAIENALMKKFSSEVTLRMTRQFAVILLDGKEAGRVAIDQPATAQASLTSGEAVIYGIREVAGMDNRGQS